MIRYSEETETRTAENGKSITLYCDDLESVAAASCKWSMGDKEEERHLFHLLIEITETLPEKIAV